MPRVQRIAEVGAQRVGLNQTDADDIAAATIADLWRLSLPQFDASRSTLEDFFAFRAFHLVRKHRRNRLLQRQREAELFDRLGSSDQVEAPNTDQQQAAALDFAHRIMATPEAFLGSDDAELLTAYLEFAHETSAELAEDIGTSEPTLSRRLARVRQAILKVFEEEGIA
ncbi:MAG: hypothetical protein AAGE65_09565 [Planctomycetota bacterium]